jgi:hypothetical protein
MAHEASGRAGYVMGVNRHRSRLYAYRFYMSSLMAHTASGQAVKWRMMFISDHGFEPSRLNGGWWSSLMKASSQAGQVTCDVHLRSRLWENTWSKLRVIQVIWREIFIPEHGFKPAGGRHHKLRLSAYKLICDHWRHTRLWAIHVSRSWLYAYRFYVWLDYKKTCDMWVIRNWNRLCPKRK